MFHVFPDAFSVARKRHSLCASAFASLSSPAVSVTPTRDSWCLDIVYLAQMSLVEQCQASAENKDVKQGMEAI